MKTLKEEWESYVKAVYPAGIPADQNRECAMAFFAGAAGMFGLMDKASELPEDEAVVEIEKLHREIESFKNYVIKIYRDNISDSSEQAENPEYR
jgi:hypothetical protein